MTEGRQETTAAKAEKSKRQDLPGGGSYVAVPGAFPGADEGIRNALKMEFRPFFSPKSADPVKVDTSFATDRFLLDIGAIDPDRLDAGKLARDCELLGEVARSQPEELRKLIRAQQRPGGFSEAYGIAKELGLTEEQAIQRGGGLLWLLVVGVLLMAGSCEHCHASHGAH